jgi:peroxiredoxin
MLKVLASFLFSLLLTDSVKANTVAVVANIKELPAGKWIYYREQGGGDKTDSVQSFKGGFKFRITIDEGEGNNFLFSIGKNYNDEHSYILLFLDKGTVTITAAGKDFTNAKFSGAASANDLQAFNTYMQSNKYMKEAPELYKKNAQYYQRNDTTGFAELQKKLKIIDSVRMQLLRQWIWKHPSSPVSVIILSDIRFSLSDSELDKEYGQLKPAATNNFPARNIKHIIDVNKLTGIGRPALDFTQPDTSGRPVSLKDFRGKYVLLDFWASWCGPCRAENPNVVAAYNKYKGKNFTVLSVSLDQPTGKQNWINAIHKDGLMWTHVSDLKFWDNAVAKQYAIESIPSNLLLDPDGTIIGKDLRGDDLNNKLAEVLK